jgi:hypothetical protein
MKFITDEGVNDTPKQIETYLNDLKGKITFILKNNYLLESLKIR